MEVERNNWYIKRMRANEWDIDQNGGREGIMCLLPHRHVKICVK